MMSLGMSLEKNLMKAKYIIEANTTGLGDWYMRDTIARVSISRVGLSAPTFMERKHSRVRPQGGECKLSFGL